MSRKVMQIGYEPERDRLTWDGWDIHCGHGMDVLLPDRLDGGTWRAVLCADGAGPYVSAQSEDFERTEILSYPADMEQVHLVY